MTTKDYTTVIKSNSSAFSLNLKELFNYRDLIWLFVDRNFKLIYKQTILGPLWLILTPIFSSVVFTIVFGQFAGLSTDGSPQFMFYMAGNTIWALFNSAVVGTANTFVVNAGVFGKIYFPRLTVPISQVITALLSFGIQFVLLIVCGLYYYITGVIKVPTVELLILPVLFIQTIMFALGIGIIVSSLTTKYRDLAIAVTFGMQLWMYITPIVYPLSTTGGLMRILLLLNPMTPIVHNFKCVMLGTDTILILPWIISFIVTIVTLIIGMLLFNKVEKTFMDTV